MTLRPSLVPDSQKSILRPPFDLRIVPAWSAWISGLAKWSHAFTMTIRPCVNGVIVSRIILEQAAQHLLRRLDYRIFGRRQVERGAHIPSVAVAGWGAHGGSPHLHFALVAPPSMSPNAFAKTVRSVARQLAWANREMRVERYLNEGWCRYMTAHHPENIILSCLRPANGQVGAMRLVGS